MYNSNICFTCVLTRCSRNPMSTARGWTERNDLYVGGVHFALHSNTRISDNNGIASTINFEIFYILRVNARPREIFFIYFSIPFYDLFLLFFSYSHLSGMRSRSPFIICHNQRERDFGGERETVECSVHYGYAFARTFSPREKCARAIFVLQIFHQFSKRNAHTIAIYFAAVFSMKWFSVFLASGTRNRLKMQMRPPTKNCYWNYIRETLIGRTNGFGTAREEEKIWNSANRVNCRTATRRETHIANSTASFLIL